MDCNKTKKKSIEYWNTNLYCLEYSKVRQKIESSTRIVLDIWKIILTNFRNNKSRNGRHEAVGGKSSRWRSCLEVICGGWRRFASGRHERYVVNGNVARPWKSHFGFYYHLNVCLNYRQLSFRVKTMIQIDKPCDTVRLIFEFYLRSICCLGCRWSTKFFCTLR